MPDTPVAFFSYSREDSEFALRLAADLRAAGASVWIDQLDIEPGQLWDRAVQSALESSPSVLIILSPASVNSDNVMDEINFALDQKKALIPVLYRDCDIPFRVRRFQHLDFRTEYDRMLQELRKCLHIGGTAQASPAAVASPSDTSAPVAHSASALPATSFQSSQRSGAAVPPTTPARVMPPAPPSPAPPSPAAAYATAGTEKKQFPLWGKIAIPVGVVVLLLIVFAMMGSNSGRPDQPAAKNQTANSGGAAKASNAGGNGGAVNGAAQVMATALMKDKTQDCTNPGSSQSDFSVNDPAVYYYFAYRNGTANDKWMVEWIGPDGYSYKQQIIQQPIVGSARYCYFIDIAGHKPAKKPGTWAARLYLNDAQKDERDFSINR